MMTLYEAAETSFETNGLGNLPDALSATVTEERNGEFEMELEYPVTGKRYEEIILRRIILAKSNPFSNPQPFRIYSITKPINGVVTVNAQHISYDLSGYPVAPFEVPNLQSALQALTENCPINCPFTFASDITTDSVFATPRPSSIRSVLGDGEGSILKEYGGEYEFDRFSVTLHGARGADRGVTIRYGKNLTDLRQEENCASVYTGVYPYWYSEDYGVVELPEKVLMADGDYGFTRILPLDLTSEFQNGPGENDLREAAAAYMVENNIGVPKISIEVSFLQLSQTREHPNAQLLETVNLCDTVTVEFPEMKVQATAQCVKTVYDVLGGRYISIELGEAASSLSSTVAEQNKTMEKLPDKTFLQATVDRASALITGGLGGYVILHSSTGGKQPDEILIMDTDSIATAKNIWRWNRNGLGFSSNGYNGPFDLAMTSDGQIVADFITVGELNGAIIKANTVKASALDVEYKTSVETSIADGDNAVTKDLTTKIQNTADAVTLQVTEETNRATGAEESLSSKLELTAESLTSSITAEKERAEGAEDSISSELKQTASAITTQVKDLDGNVTTMKQTLDSFQFTVSDPVTSTEGQSYVTMSISMGGNTWRGVVKIDGNVDISGSLSAEALYAAMGDIAQLTVNSLSTSRRIPLYLAGDTSDDNYIDIRDKHIRLMRGVTDGSSEQARNPNGALLYWEKDVSDAVLASDGYPYVDGSRVFTTTSETDWPVMVYSYVDSPRRSLTFNEDELRTPIDVFGDGYGADDPNRGKGFIQKEGRSFNMWLLNSLGEKRGIFLGDQYTDITGLRKPTGLNFSEWDSGHFYERVDGDDTRYAYSVEFDAEGRPVKITDSDGHETAIYW